MPIMVHPAEAYVAKVATGFWPKGEYGFLFSVHDLPLSQGGFW